MRAEIRALMGRQHGLVTRPQVLACGLTHEEILRLLRSGTWTAVRRGVYCETAVAVAAQGSTRSRRLLADRAASLRIGAPHVPSHDFAAHELGMQVLNAKQEYTHVTRPGIVGAHLKHGVKHHLAPYPEKQLVDVDGRLVLGRARTAIDIAREHGNPAGTVAVDDARRNGVPTTELWDVLDGMPCWPYRLTAKEAIEESDGDADSILETLGRILITELGHGKPQTQFGMTADGRTAWADLRLGRHLFECDGRTKLVPVSAGGVATKGAEDVLWDAKLRRDWLQGFRLGMSIVVWADVLGPGRSSALVRFGREYLATCAAFGTDISDLAQFKPRGPRPRPGGRGPTAA